MIHAMIEFEEDEPAMMAILETLNNELNRLRQANVKIWFTSRWPDVVSVTPLSAESGLYEGGYESVNIHRLIEELAKEPAGAGIDGILRAAQRVNPPPVKRGRRKTKSTQEAPCQTK